MLRRVVWRKSEAFSGSIIIALMMGAVNTCEMSVSFYETARRNIVPGSHFQYLACCISIHNLNLIVELIFSILRDF